MDFLLTICMAAIASAVFRLLVPESKLSKQISLLIVCVFLLTGINAVTGAELTLSPDIIAPSSTEEYISFSGEVNRELQKKICKDMSDKLYAVLGKNGIYPEQIHVNVNISGLYSISITQVKLMLPAEQRDKAAEAHAIAAAELTEDIRLTVEIKE
ncbi:MAG: hypothetical protein IJO91_05170 [Oscillospiraceae bacterium]|nr:hypothetical protein [Oscillospiraceae bacterium]